VGFVTAQANTICNFTNFTREQILNTPQNMPSSDHGGPTGAAA